ncbi:MAG: hypothetical protein R2911_21260 [Caldilineaceae bacterium]
MKNVLSRTLAVLALLLVFSHAAIAQTGEPEALSADVDIPCPSGNLLGEADGETIICGQIEVPENWDEPDGTTINIAYAVLKSRGLAPFSDPIIYFAGGPGGSALATTGQSVQFFEGPRRMHDIVLWDQRGTTYSNLLHCPLCETAGCGTWPRWMRGTPRSPSIFTQILKLS